MRAQIHEFSGPPGPLPSKVRREVSLVTSLPGGALIVCRDGRVGECNTLALDMLGAPLLNEPWSAVIERAFLPRQDDGHEVSLCDGRRVRIVTEALSSGEGQLVQLIDLTESRAWQDKVAHHQRVFALGQMAATLAHQLRTPLSTATLYASHLAQGQLSGDQGKHFARQLLTQLATMESQIQTLLLLARRELPLCDRLTLPALTASWQVRWPRLQHAPLPSDLERTQVLVHAQALIEAMDNLVRNAEEVSPGQVRLVLRRCARELHVEVHDAGAGLDAADLAALERPFHSSKPNGHGLGLALVRSIMAAHAGCLRVRSQRGEGSVFALVLPLLEEKQS